MEADQIILFQIEIANPCRLIVLRVGNLIMIFAQRGDPAELIVGVGIIEQRKKSAYAAALIVDDLRNRRRQAQLRAASVQARVVGKALGVAADIDLIVGGIEVSGRRDQFGLIVALEAGRRHHVEESVGPIAILAGKTAALDLQFLHVLGIDQRRDVGRDIRIDHGYAVEKPVHLVAAAHVEHVVNHVRAGREIGDHRQAVGLIRAGGLGDLLRRNHGLHGRRLCVQPAGGPRKLRRLSLPPRVRVGSARRALCRPSRSLAAQAAGSPSPKRRRYKRPPECR